MFNRTSRSEKIGITRRHEGMNENNEVIEFCFANTLKKGLLAVTTHWR